MVCGEFEVSATSDGCEFVSSLFLLTWPLLISVDDGTPFVLFALACTSAGAVCDRAPSDFAPRLGGRPGDVLQTTASLTNLVVVFHSFQAAYVFTTQTALGSGLETGSRRWIAVKFDCSYIFSLRSFLELIVVYFQRVEQREYVRPPASFRVCGSGAHDV